MSLQPKFILRSITATHWHFIQMYDVYPWTMPHLHVIRPMDNEIGHCDLYLLRDQPLHCAEYLSKCLLFIHEPGQDMKQNRWTLKYKSLWTTLFKKWLITASHQFFIPKYDVVHPWNTLQYIKQNHWTLKSLWPTFIMRSIIITIIINLCVTDSLSQSIMFIHQIAFKI